MTGVAQETFYTVTFATFSIPVGERPVNRGLVFFEQLVVYELELRLNPDNTIAHAALAEIDDFSATASPRQPGLFNNDSGPFYRFTRPSSDTA